MDRTSHTNGHTNGHTTGHTCDRLLARAARWMALLRLTRTLVISLSIATALMVVARGAAILTSIEVPWGMVWLWAMVSAAVIAIAWTWFTRPAALAVARRVDEGAALRERLSTALAVRGMDDPWTKATIDDAERIAGGVLVRQAIPAAMPKLWPAPLLAMGLFFLIGLINPIDVFGWGDERDAEENQAQELIAAQKTLAETKTAVKQADALLAEHGAEMANPDEPMDEPIATPRTPEEMRLEAARKLTSATAKLDALRGEKSKKLDAMRQKMARLKTPANTPAELGAFMKSMQKGDFGDASKALQAMQEAMQNAEQSSEQKEAFKKALEDMAKQLEQLAKQRDALEQALADAGLDRNLAGDPDALKQALENAQNLNQAQRDALQKMAQNQQFANQQCQNMGQAMQQMAQNAGGPNPDQMAQAMGQMAGQLSDLEMMQMTMKDMQAQMAQMQKLMGQAGQCQNPGDAMSWFANSQPGKGKTGRGKGGGQMDSEAAPFALKKDKAIGKNLGGPIVGSTLIEAGQIKGESVQQFSEAVQAGAAEASQAIEEMQVPREYQEAVKGYFENLNGTVSESAPAQEEATDDDSDE